MSVLCVFFVCALQGGLGRTPHPEGPALAPVAVPRRPSAALQLDWARAVRARMHAAGAEGSVPASASEKAAARQAAVQAFRAVGRYFPQEGSTAAEAAFRAGELLRAGGSGGEALREFQRVRDLDRGSRWAARATLEIGHVLRREGRYELAEEAYYRASTETGAYLRDRDSALSWAARVVSLQGREEAARRVWRRVLMEGDDLGIRVRALDALLASLLAHGDCDAARTELRAARVRLRAWLEELTERGRRARSAWSRMVSPALLRRACARMDVSRVVR